MKTEAALAYAERQLAASEARAASWRQIVEGLRGLNGDAPVIVLVEHAAEPAEVTLSLPAESRPRGMEAVRRIVAERPGRWTLRELHAELDRRGWRHTADKRRFHAAVDAAVHRMAKLGEAQHVASGTYEFPARERKEGAVESDASGVAMITS